jgi:hypothetical protein
MLVVDILPRDISVLMFIEESHGAVYRHQFLDSCICIFSSQGKY